MRYALAVAILACSAMAQDSRALVASEIAVAAASAADAATAPNVDTVKSNLAWGQERNGSDGPHNFSLTIDPAGSAVSGNVSVGGNIRIQ